MLALAPPPPAARRLGSGVSLVSDDIDASTKQLNCRSTVDGVQRVFVDSANSTVHMRNHDGTARHSFALDKESCVTQLPCVF